MQYAILTGSSRGLGAGLVRQLTAQDFHVLGLARRAGEPAGLPGFQHIPADLSTPAAVTKAFAAAEEALPPVNELKALWLINNAGLIEPLAPIGTQDAAALQQQVQVNLTAALLLTNAFVGLCQDWPIRKLILNISSGAAHRPVHGWSIYNTTKAALLMATRALAAEQAEETHPIQALSIAPGVVESQMQKTIRDKTEAETAVVERFRRLKAEGELLSPDASAARVLAIAQDPKAQPGQALDIRG